MKSFFSLQPNKIIVPSFICFIIFLVSSFKTILFDALCDVEMNISFNEDLKLSLSCYGRLVPCTKQLLLVCFFFSLFYFPPFKLNLVEQFSAI